MMAATKSTAARIPSANFNLLPGLPQVRHQCFDPFGVFAPVWRRRGSFIARRCRLRGDHARQFRNVNSHNINLFVIARLGLHVVRRDDAGLREPPRFFHTPRQFDGALARITRHSHLQFQLVVVIQRRVDRHDVHPRRHHLFQTFQNTRPRERLAFDHVIQKLRLIPCRAVLRTIQERLCIGPNLVALGDHRLLLRQRRAVPAGIDPARDVERQQHQCQQGDRADSRAPAHPELPRILVRLAREIDIKTHKSNQ